ncbi:hypothetical protein E2C01_028577 [Portunus trituberculatus]|uniref:Uncharacterized protein n=1 Tax=Portunus trituberculatus TaxID=210409 RepID=A0A5B7EKU0_PORTR|nr:hypothetical protein [Portunus trituberculatus]
MSCTLRRSKYSEWVTLWRPAAVGVSGRPVVIFGPRTDCLTIMYSQEVKVDLGQVCEAACPLRSGSQQE